MAGKRYIEVQALQRKGDNSMLKLKWFSALQILHTVKKAEEHVNWEKERDKSGPIYLNHKTVSEKRKEKKQC